MRLAERIGERLVGQLVAGAGRLAAAALLAVALGQTAILVARKAGFATVAAQETVMALAVPAVLLAIPWALLEGRHVAVDLFAGRVAARIGLVLALVLGLALLWLAIPYAYASWAVGEGSADLMGRGYRWVAKAVLPLFAALLSLGAALLLLARPR